MVTAIGIPDFHLALVSTDPLVPDFHLALVSTDPLVRLVGYTAVAGCVVPARAPAVVVVVVVRV